MNTFCPVRTSLLIPIISAPLLTTAAPLIVDHNAVNQYTNLTATDITRVKKMWISLAGESHSSGYRNGCQLLMNLDPRFKVGIQDSGTPEGDTPDHLRISRATWGYSGNSAGWTYSYGEADWFTSPYALGTTKAGLMYCATTGPKLDVLGFGWCWDMSCWWEEMGGGTNMTYGTRWAGSSSDGPDGNRRWGLTSADYPLTGNRICMDTYLNATEEYRSFCASNGINTKVIFTTGPVDRMGADENSYQTAVKNQFIRDYVSTTSDGILFDYADILSWDDAGMQKTMSWRDFNGILKSFPTIADDNTLDLDGGSTEDGDHIGERGALRLAKALWWMLAQINAKRVDAPVITNFTLSGTSLTLGWTPTSNQFIVVRSVNLDKAPFEFVGGVLSTNQTSLTRDTDTAFFGIREVTVVDVPDPGLRSSLNNAITPKFTPPEKLYDIELKSLTTLQASSADIRNASGLDWCGGLTNLNISLNQLNSLTLAGYPALKTLDCSRNNLTNLDISSCTNLILVNCASNHLPDISAFITNASRGGLGAGDVVHLSGNPLSPMAVTNQIPQLQGFGVTVIW